MVALMRRLWLTKMTLWEPTWEVASTLRCHLGCQDLVRVNTAKIVRRVSTPFNISVCAYWDYNDIYLSRYIQKTISFFTMVKFNSTSLLLSRMLVY